MGRVKSEMFEDDLGSDDELVPKRTGEDIQKEIEGCEIPRGTQERREFMHKKLRELIDHVSSK
jgi:hypothetical protein|tara:strand:- start:72 stop:260 length:189 start_codon:yes stop_codon:yes gene_type:complete